MTGLFVCGENEWKIFRKILIYNQHSESEMLNVLRSLKKLSKIVLNANKNYIFIITQNFIQYEVEHINTLPLIIRT